MDYGGSCARAAAREDREFIQHTKHLFFCLPVTRLFMLPKLPVGQLRHRWSKLARKRQQFKYNNLYWKNGYILKPKNTKRHE